MARTVERDAPGIPCAEIEDKPFGQIETGSLRRAGSQSHPSPAAVANADGSTTVYFGPSKPAGVSDGNWIQTVPGKGWSTLLRLYSPLEPFFTKEWRPSEIEEVTATTGRGSR